jgi:hypothetical protein
MKYLWFLLLSLTPALAQCPSYTLPFPTEFVVNGNDQFAIDNTSYDFWAGPSEPGTLVECRRLFFNDDPNAKSQGFKNSFVSINHLFGSTTKLTNQDRGLSVFAYNLPTDTSRHYSMTAYQIEVDVNGSPTFGCDPAAPPGFCAPDGEIASGSFQVADLHTGTPTAPNMGPNAIRAQIYRRGDNWGSCEDGACWVGVDGIASNLSRIPGNTSIIAGLRGKCSDGTGLATNLICVGGYFPASTGKFKYNWGVYINDWGSGPNDWNFRSYANTPNSGREYHGGPMYVETGLRTDHLTNTDLGGSGTMPLTYIFAEAFTATPICVSSDITTGAPTLPAVNKAGTVWFLTVQGTTGNTANYICIGRQ